MDKAMTISRLLVASLAVWRLSRLLFGGRRYNGRFWLFPKRQKNFFGNRISGWIPEWIPDCVCWLSIWLSAQTAIWVAGGIAAVFLNWVALTAVSRLLTTPAEAASDPSWSLGLPVLSRNLPVSSLDVPLQLGTETRNGDFSCLTVERTLQVNHG